MNSVETLVVGAGHAGLAVSNLLSAAGHEHVVIERGRVGERWRTERWDSLRLLTPNWMTRLPGLQERPWPLDAYLSAADFAGLLDRYAAAFTAPVIERTSVIEVTPAGSGSSYSVVTDRGCWRTRNLVIATGPHGRPSVPPALRGWAHGSVDVIPSRQYRNPTQLPPGGVLVVGAASSGVQIAYELADAGRTVVLAVGRHSRLPRRSNHEIRYLAHLELVGDASKHSGCLFRLPSSNEGVMGAVRKTPGRALLHAVQRSIPSTRRGERSPCTQQSSLLASLTHCAKTGYVRPRRRASNGRRGRPDTSCHDWHVTKHGALLRAGETSATNA